MREIKFRGYAVPQMVGSQWLYGFGVDPIEYAEEYAKEIGRTRDWYLYTDNGPYQVHEKSIGQYTGLKDKNGKEIYEGDILKVHEGDDWTWTQDVKYFSGGFWLHDETCLGAVHSFCEVIGNMYETPDLLETKE